MADEWKVWMGFFVSVCVLVTVAVGGCTASEHADHEYRRDMAKQGYVEVFELLPGCNGPVRYWRKAEDVVTQAVRD